MYVIRKVLNNNVVVAKSQENDVILVGKGIGYDLKKGSNVPEERIESIFIRQNGDQNNKYDKIIKNINNKVIAVCEEIISYCEKTLNMKLNESIHFSLIDHINFALQRIEKGIKIENPFLNELKVLYPREFEIAEHALNLINNEFETKLPKDEIGFICLHIRAATTKRHVGTSLTYTRKIKDIMDFIARISGIEFNENSFQYVRVLTHINFMLERIKENQPIKNELINSIKKEMYVEYNMAMKVALKIETIFDVKIPEDEVGYIALHLRRLVN